MATMKLLRHRPEPRQSPRKVGYMLLTLVLCFSFQGIVGDYCSSDCKFEQCVCTEEYVECHNEPKLDHDIKTLFPCIKDNITKFINTGSHFIDLTPNFLGSCKNDPSLVLHRLKYLDLSHNNIRTIHGKSFHCMNQLETLVLAHNDWMIDYHTDQTGYFTSLPALKHLDLTNAFDEVWNGSIHIDKLVTIFRKTDMTKLETLQLAHNELFTFSEHAANSLCELDSLKTLNLSHNLFSSPALPTLPNCLEELETIDVSYNKMPRLPQEFMSKVDSMNNLQYLYLGHNDYMCDCSLIDTYNWMMKTRSPIHDPDEIICADGYHSSYINKTVLSLKPGDLQCLQLPAPSSTAVQVVTGIIFAVIAVAIITFLVVHRAHVRRLFSKWRRNLPAVSLRPHSGYSSVQEAANV